MRIVSTPLVALLLTVPFSSGCELLALLDPDAPPPLDRDPRYRVIDIGASDGVTGVNISENYRTSRPHDLNENGEVVGRVRGSDDDFKGFYFSEDEGLLIVEPFGYDGPAPEAVLMTIQDDGTAWGFATGYEGDASTSTAFSWTLGGEKVIGPDPDTYGEPWASNDTTVVGACRFNSRACDVGTMGVYFADAVSSGDVGDGGARGINDDGDVVGWVWSEASGVRTMRPSIWNAGDALPTDLGSLNGDPDAEGQPYAINNNRTVLGYTNADDGSVGFIWTEETGMTPTEALDPGNDNIRLIALNNDDVMVGGNWDEHAVIVEDGVLENLNRFIEEDSGWWLHFAYAINDAGWIAGEGTLNDEPHMFLLAPLEE